ncbi:hypothetical protein [Salmonella phage SSBI34]|nr:hypothetical protein [Salmonella phage SSBI34]
MGYKSKQDLSEMERYFGQLTDLADKEVEYGFYDEQHYSGLNMATLAAIHEYGWNKLPERNFIYSTSIHYKQGLQKHIRNMHTAIIQGKSFDSYLNKIGKDGADSIRMTIDQGGFSNPKVSKDWARVKGFDDAMVHYGDLASAATYKVVKYQGK